MMEGFLGAVLGAIIGGILAYLGAMKSARFMMKETADLDRKRREEERAEVHNLLASRLLAEMKENIVILANPKPEWGFAVALREAWDLAKGQVIFPAGVIGAVGKAYLEVSIYNTIVSAAMVDHDSVRYVRNFTIVEDRAEKVRGELEKAVPLLEGYLTKACAK
jgi:hypothetical protein